MCHLRKSLGSKFVFGSTNLGFKLVLFFDSMEILAKKINIKTVPLLFLMMNLAKEPYL